MEINFQNIEEMFFLDKNVRELLPEFRNDFDSWRISQMSPGLRQLGQKSLMNVLNGLEKEQLQRLTDHFGKQVFVGRLNANIVEHYNFTNEQHDDLCKYTEFKDFCITMNKDGVVATFWR
jgi:hypothetical protein